jgi:predicted HicB family RNase H-like nuclease
MDETKKKGRVPMKFKDWMIRNFPVDLQKQAKIRAVEMEISLKQLVINALTAYLKKGGAK